MMPISTNARMVRLSIRVSPLKSGRDHSPIRPMGGISRFEIIRNMIRGGNLAFEWLEVRNQNKWAGNDSGVRDKERQQLCRHV